MFHCMPCSFYHQPDKMNDDRKVVCSIIKSFLGPNKSNKFVTEDKDVCFARCPLYILQNYISQDNINCLLEETLFAHHEFYGCSTLTLLAMWYFWCEEIRSALEEGCDIKDVMEHSQNILEEVISTLPQITMSLDEMLTTKKLPTKITGRNTTKKTNYSNAIPISIRYSSRHFSPSKSVDDSDEENTACPVDESSLVSVVRSLDHDEVHNISDLVLECWKKQILFTKCTKFKKDDLLICPIILPCNSSTVVDGLIIKSNFNYTQCTDRMNAYTNRALIIMGSVSYEYVHLGFSPKVFVNSLSAGNPSVAKRDQWRERCCDVIKQLNINILLVKDDVDSEIASFCLSKGVLVLHPVPTEAFKIICNMMKYSPCTYIWDCKERDVIHNFIFKEWKPKDLVDDGDKYFLLNTNGNSVFFQTLVVCHPSTTVLKMYQHQVQHFISRLNLAFESRKLLLGAGRVEKWCCEFLECQKSSKVEVNSRIRTALLNGFKNYSIVVEVKKMLSGKSHEIMDEMSSKVSAWRSALSLVLLTLQCDIAIVNEENDTTNCKFNQYANIKYI